MRFFICLLKHELLQDRLYYIMQCLVTGGAGFIGSHLVDRLLKNGHTVVVLDDFSLGKEENIAHHRSHPRFMCIRQSICKNLDEIFRSHTFDVVFHLAALPRVQFSIQFPRETHEVNINGTLHLLLACQKFQVRRFVFSASSSVYGEQSMLPLTETMKPNPMSPYALQKLVGEHYAQLFFLLHGLETISLRYFNVFGSRQNPEGEYACLIPRFISLISRGAPPPIRGDGEQMRDFTYVEDVVEANVLASTTKNKACFGEVFNIGAGRAISVNVVARTIAQLCKTDSRPIYGPAVVEPRSTLADRRKAKAMLGWEPATPFEEGLRNTIESITGE